MRKAWDVLTKTVGTVVIVSTAALTGFIIVDCILSSIKNKKILNDDSDFDYEDEDDEDELEDISLFDDDDSFITLNPSTATSEPAAEAETSTDSESVSSETSEEQPVKRRGRRSTNID